MLLLTRRWHLYMPLQVEVQLSQFSIEVESAQYDAHECHMAVSLSDWRICSPDVLKSVFVLQVFEKLGLSLYDFLRVNQYRPLRIDVVRDFGRQLLESVAYLHGLDLIHTDLKPENILLAACDDDRKSPTPGIRSAMLPPCFYFSCWLCALLPLLLLPLLLFFPCALSTQIFQQILLTACGKWRTLLRPDVVMTITGFPPLLQQSGDSPVK